MGDRNNVHVVEPHSGGPGVYLYTHWEGSMLPGTVARALDRGRDRWTDTAYLTRIIFCEMVKGSEEGTTGYGISTTIQDQDGGNQIQEVNVEEQTVNGVAFEAFIEAHKAGV